MKFSSLLITCLLLLLLVMSTAHAQNEGELVVFAASSLTDAYESIADAFEAEYPGVNVLFNFGGSSTLATQLVQGAPADVFASANDNQMAIVVESNRITEPVHTFAKNRLVLIIPSDNPAEIHSLGELANPGVHLILAAPDVPVRAYTDIMLDRLANDTTYGEAYVQAVLNNIVSEEPNVRQVAAKIALGEADAGIVYLSDITPDIANDVIALPIPDTFNTIATYPIAVLDDSTQPELANLFVDFVLSDSGQEILVEWGFTSIRGDRSILLVDGEVMNPLALTIDDLQASFSSQTIEVNYIRDNEAIITTFTGVTLRDVLQSAQPNLDGNLINGSPSLNVVMTGIDGQQVTIGWAEIDFERGDQLILIAWAENGEVFEDGLRLVWPDTQDKHTLNGLFNISLIDIPPSED